MRKHLLLGQPRFIAKFAVSPAKSQRSREIHFCNGTEIAKHLLLNKRRKNITERICGRPNEIEKSPSRKRMKTFCVKGLEGTGPRNDVRVVFTAVGYVVVGSFYSA